MAYPSADPRQRALQGALLCQDWPGPLLWNRPLLDDFAVTAADIPDYAATGPAVVFAFACYGAGTPSADDYAHLLGTPPENPPEVPFVARLPQRLIGHPHGRTLAFIGHVERALDCSFVSPLRSGHPGDVLRRYCRHCSAAGGSGTQWSSSTTGTRAAAAGLSETLDGARRYGTSLDDVAVAGLWTEHNDARNYIVLGDPAMPHPRTPTLAATGP